jgi:hypothetical protein
MKKDGFPPSFFKIKEFCIRIYMFWDPRKVVEISIEAIGSTLWGYFKVSDRICGASDCILELNVESIYVTAFWLFGSESIRVF